MGEWFKDWFSSDFYLSVYSHRNDEDAAKFLNKILDFIPLKEGTKVLDAACGAGRHSIIMAQKNFPVTAFDLSRPLLDVARQKAAELKLDINFCREDLRYVSYDEKFGLILNLFTSFGYFHTDEENFAFIRSAYNMQDAGGFFIFDFFNEAYLRRHVVAESQKTIDGLKIFEKRSIRDNRIVKEIRIEKEGESLNYEESVQLYSFSRIIEQFNEIGYKAIKVFGSYECTDFLPEDSERLIIIFQK